MNHSKPYILVVDDEKAIVSSIIRALEDSYECLGAENTQQAREHFQSHEIACILCDQRMPGETGDEFLSWVKENHPETVRLLITGYSDFDSVVSAVNNGQIFQFLQKPWEPMQLELVLKQAVQLWFLTREKRDLQEQLKRRNEYLETENVKLRTEVFPEQDPFVHLIGVSPAMHELKKKMMQLLGSDSTILIRGESGTGKELVAKALHYHGKRKGKPFIAQNCAALPESILESELFGYKKGSFTHATEDRAGILETANGGTLFLDEIGDMKLAMQAKLLRFLQEGTFTPIGSRIEKRVNVRVIAATHRNLEKMAEEGEFRRDLFYRLNVIPLVTPSLRNRKEDIPLLAECLMRRISEKMGRSCPKLSQPVRQLLSQYDFPGNVKYSGIQFESKQRIGLC